MHNTTVSQTKKTHTQKSKPKKTKNHTSGGQSRGKLGESEICWRRAKLSRKRPFNRRFSETISWQSAATRAWSAGWWAAWRWRSMADQATSATSKTVSTTSREWEIPWPCFIVSDLPLPNSDRFFFFFFFLPLVCPRRSRPSYTSCSKRRTRFSFVEEYGGPNNWSKQKFPNIRVPFVKIITMGDILLFHVFVPGVSRRVKCGSTRDQHNFVNRSRIKFNSKV